MSGVLTWDDVRGLVERNDRSGIVAALAGLDERRRRALASDLIGYERTHRLSAADGWPLDPHVVERARRAESLAVAAAGVLAPSALVPVLTRTPWRWSWTDDRPDALPDLLDCTARAVVARGPQQAATLIDRLAAAQDERVHDLLDAILRRTGAEPPPDPGFRSSWFGTLPADELGLRAELARGPGWTHALEEILALDTNGTRLLDRPQLARHLATLADDGTLRRGALLDSLVARMQRPERPRDVTGVLLVHEALAPTVAEVRERRADYLAVLPAGPAKAAATALKQLRAAWGGHPGGEEVAVAAAARVLVRPETGLATAQLTWLNDATRRLPPGGDLDRLVTAALAGFAHPATSVRERAVALAVRHLEAVSPPVRAQARTSSADLPADLRRRLAGAAAPGGPTAPSTPSGRVVPGPVVPGPASPEPAAEFGLIGSPAETAEEVATLLATPPDGPVDAMLLERVLAALVEGARADLPGLRAALAPVIAGPRPSALLSTLPGDAVDVGTPFTAPQPWEPADATAGLVAVLRAVVTGRPPGRPRGARWAPARWVPGWPGSRGPRVYTLGDGGGPLSIVQGRRLYELADGLAGSVVPALLSTPTLADGRLHPHVLERRLRHALEAPLPVRPADLTLALLRCPPDGLDGVAVLVGALDLPDGAAAALAGWVRSPRTLAGVSAVPSPGAVATERWRRAEPGPEHLLACCGAGSAPAPVVELWGDVVDAPVDLLGLPVWSWLAWCSTWPSLLPHHRDVVAAHLQRVLLAQGTGHVADAVTAALPLLAEAHGPAGPGLHLALLYGLAASDAGTRPAAVDGLVTLAARDPGVPHTAVDAREAAGWPYLGALLGRLLARRAFPVGRVVAGLRDVGGAGAWPAVRCLLLAALPHLLPPGGAPPDGTDLPTGVHLLLALASEATEAAPGLPAPSPVELGGLREVAARRGGSRTVVEARRLLGVLDGS